MKLLKKLTGFRLTLGESRQYGWANSWAVCLAPDREKKRGDRMIKFRAWDPDVNEFVFSQNYYDEAYFEFKDGTLKAFAIRETQIGPPEEWLSSDELEPVEQWTGFQDSKGQDVYEGDILTFPNTTPFIIEWDNDRGEFTKWLPRNRVTIIGNIHETPELLTVI